MNVGKEFKTDQILDHQLSWMRQHKRIFCDCELTNTLLGLVWVVLLCINGLFSHYKYSYLSLFRLKKGNQVLLICCLSCATSTNNIDPDQVSSVGAV